MPIEPLPLDPSVEARIFRALVAVFMADPDLDRVVATWQVWDGDGAEERPIAEAMLPAVRLTPDLQDIRLESPEYYREGLTVAIDMVVAGTNADDRLNLWGAVQRALRLQNETTLRAKVDGSPFAGTTVGQYLRAHGVTEPFFVAPARLVPAAAGQPSVHQYSRAGVAIPMYTP